MGDTIQLIFAVSTDFPTPIGTTNTFNSTRLSGMSASVSLSPLGGGAAVEVFSGIDALNGFALSDPACSGSAPTPGSNTASWSNMTVEATNFPGSCRIAVEITLPDTITPGFYTLSPGSLTGFETPTVFDTSTFTSTDNGSPTAFSLPLNSAGLTVTADTTAPTGEISAPSGPVEVGVPFDVTVSFSEPVIGFDASDISVSPTLIVENFTAVTDEAGDASLFRFQLTPGVRDIFTIDIAAGAATDDAGNANADVSSVTVEADDTRPSFTASVVDDPADPGTTATLRYTITNNDPSNALSGGTFVLDVDQSLSSLAVSALPSGGFCGASSAAAGTAFLAVQNIEIAAGGSCVFDVTLSVPGGASGGTYALTSTALNYTLNSSSASVDPAIATLDVSGAEGTGAPANFTKSFQSDFATPGGTIDLEFTIAAPENASTSAMTFTDDLDAVIQQNADIFIPIS